MPVQGFDERWLIPKLGKLVRELHPLPLVPDLIEPLRPLPRSLRRPTWEQFVSAYAPPVRELPAGQRPSDWANDMDEAIVEREAPSGRRATPERDANLEGDENLESGDHLERDANLERGEKFERETSVVDEAEGAGVESVSSASGLPALARVERSWMARPPVTGPQQYQVQFSTTEEHVILIERAKGLLARDAPGKSLGELHLRAIRLLVSALEKQKFAVTERPRKKATRAMAPDAMRRMANGVQPAPLGATLAAASTTQGVTPEPIPRSANSLNSGANELFPPSIAPRERGRHIPAEVRRAAFERDGGRCTYVDERGERCRETGGLELHHRQAFGKRGPHTVENLTLHCSAHNALAAELDFGREHMAVRRESRRHESLVTEERAGAREAADRTD
jgi:hypothetical protein